MKNTDTKEKILELLFNFPNRKFHVRELSRILKISAPAVSKALKQLEKVNKCHLNSLSLALVQKRAMEEFKK